MHISTSSSFLVGPIVPSCGSRQRIPYPFLFVICTKDFSSLIRKSVLIYGWQGFKVSKSASVLTHLFFFADDSLLFMKANMKSITALQGTLHKHGVVSGQCIDVDKSAGFSPKIFWPLLKQICSNDWG